MANSFTLASGLDRVRGNPSLSHSAVSPADPESARDFLFAAHLVTARDTYYFSDHSCVNTLEMERRSSLVAQSAFTDHSPPGDCTGMVRASESFRVDVQSSSQQLLRQ